MMNWWWFFYFHINFTTKIFTRFLVFGFHCKTCDKNRLTYNIKFCRITNHKCFYFSQCWKSCSSPSSQTSSSNVKLNKSQLDVIKLKIISMIRDGSLTSADITWSSSLSSSSSMKKNVPSQCLVTWEVSGGGLMGNLLTDSPDVELSLLPDTKYRVQVTCKNKVSILFIFFFFFVAFFCILLNRLNNHHSYRILLQHICSKRIQWNTISVDFVLYILLFSTSIECIYIIVSTRPYIFKIDVMYIMVLEYKFADILGTCVYIRP